MLLRRTRSDRSAIAHGPSNGVLSPLAGKRERVFPNDIDAGARSQSQPSIESTQNVDVGKPQRDKDASIRTLSLGRCSYGHDEDA